MSIISVTEFIEAAAAALAALRLLHLGLWRTQWALSAFVSFSAAYLFSLALLSPRSQEYFTVYFYGTVTGWILSAAAVGQVFALVLKSYQGIRTAARWIMYAALAGAVAVSVAVSGAAWKKGPSGHSALLFYAESINRSVVLTLAIFIVLFLILLSRYPLHLQRNTIVSCAFFGALFLSEALITLIDTLSPRLYSAAVDAIHVSVWVAGFGLWALLLRREAHSPRKIVFNSPHEERLLSELDSLNALLSRTARK